MRLPLRQSHMDSRSGMTYAGDHWRAICEALACAGPGPRYDVGNWKEKKNFEAVAHSVRSIRQAAPVNQPPCLAAGSRMCRIAQGTIGPLRD